MRFCPVLNNFGCEQTASIDAVELSRGLNVLARPNQLR